MVELCSMDFHKRYGPHGEDFIEVHHLTPLSTLDPAALKRTAPKTDMVVVCLNCHRMIHRRLDKILTLEEVNTMIRNQAKSPGFEPPVGQR